MRIIYKERIEKEGTDYAVWKQRSIDIGRGKFQTALIDIIDEEMDATTGMVEWVAIIWSTRDITCWFKNKFDKLTGRGLYAKN